MLKKKQKIQYAILMAIAIVWYAAWQMGMDEVFIEITRPTFLEPWFDYRVTGRFSFYILAVGAAIIAAKSDAYQKKLTVLVALFVLYIWISPQIFEHYTFFREWRFWSEELEIHKNLIPFHGMMKMFVRQMFYPFRCNWDSWRNILLFLPLGIVVAGSRKKGVWLLVTAGVACGIEVLEFCMSIGIVDIDDIIYRVLGIAIGYGVGKLVLLQNRVQVVEI